MYLLALFGVARLMIVAVYQEPLNPASLLLISTREPGRRCGGASVREERALCELPFGAILLVLWGIQENGRQSRFLAGATETEKDECKT